jgi:hypothetical protein
MSAAGIASREAKRGTCRAGLGSRRAGRPCLVLVALLGVGALSAGAEEPVAPAEAPPAVGLDQLLRLPKSAGGGVERKAVAGVSREQWRTRYSLLKDSLVDERRKLDSAMQELQEIAGDTSSWQMAAPGVGASRGDAPLSFRLRQEIRQGREEIERLERSLKDLLIEAELAGVPVEWLMDEPEAEDAAAIGSTR